MAGKILVPLDGRAGSEAVLPSVAEAARARRATVRLLHVAPPVEAVVAADGRVIAYADQEATRVTHRVRTYLMTAAAGLPDIEVEVAVRCGNPVAEILDDAESAGVDLIAMATHRRTGLRRPLARLEGKAR